jgi:protein-tyrosine phosphatase
MVFDYYEVEGPWLGRLAIVARPRGGDWLADEAAAWRRAGVGVVVSLLTSDEATELGVADEGPAVRAAGMEFIPFPIPDRGVPEAAAAASLFASLAAGLAAGKTVAVHCRQGIGRSALIAAGLLIRAGLGADAAVARVAAARGLPVPETADQRRWLTTVGAAARDRLPA